jgi:hypothetical protein
VIHGENFAGAAHAGHDFVRDEQNSLLAADLSDPLEITVRRNRGTESGADDGFEDERGGGGGVVGIKKLVEVVGAGYAAIGKNFTERTVIAEAGGDMSPIGEQRSVRSAANDIATYGHGAESAAMIALAAGDDAIARRLAGFEMELAS